MSILAPRRERRLLSARTWRRRGVFVLRQLRVADFRRARWRNCSRRRPCLRGFARRTLCGRWGAGGTTSELGAFFQPRLIFVRLIDDERTLHSVMSETAKLAADDFVGAGLDRFKPHRDERARNGVA